MKKILFLLAAGLLINLVPGEHVSQAEATYFSCFDAGWSGIQQDLCSGSCPGDVFKFRAANTASSYSWSVFQGATIISGQNSRIVTVQSPSSGGFSIRLNAGGNSYFDLAEFSAQCP